MKTLIPVLSFLFFISIFPKGVTKEKAEIAANSFLLQLKLMEKRLDNFTQEIISVDQIEDKGEVNGYIINLLPQGFIIISGDDDLQPVIAYSFKRNWDKKSPLVKLISEDLKYRKDLTPFLKKRNSNIK